MYLGEKEDPLEWQLNIISAIYDISNIEEQKLLWSGMNPEFVSSFTEVMARLMDDLDFDRFLNYYKSINGENNFYFRMNVLYYLIRLYQPIGYSLELKTNGYQLILDDPRWLEISKKALEIIIDIHKKV